MKIPNLNPVGIQTPTGPQETLNKTPRVRGFVQSSRFNPSVRDRFGHDATVTIYAQLHK